MVCDEIEVPAKLRKPKSDEVDTNEVAAARKEATDVYSEYEQNAIRGRHIICESIFDTVLEEFLAEMSDPVLLWKSLAQKFNRKSVAGQDRAQRNLLLFEHHETETADQTIKRFQQVVKVCIQQ